MKEAATRKGNSGDGASLDVVTSAAFKPLRGASNGSFGFEIEPIQLQPRFQPNSDGRYHVNDLLKFHDSSFIQNAYRAILKRGPDAAGYRTFLTCLRTAQLNKIDILAQLRYSAEGRAKQVEIDGLWLPAMIRKAYRVPAVGYLLNLSIALARLPLLIRNQQQFEAHVLAQQEAVVDQVNHIGRTLIDHAEDVSQRLQTQLASTQGMLDQLSAISGRTGQLDIELENLRRDLRRSFTEQAAIREDFEKQLSAHESRLVSEATDRQALSQQLNETSIRLDQEIAALQLRHKQWTMAMRAKEWQLQQADAANRDLVTAQQAELNQQQANLERVSAALKNEVAKAVHKQQHIAAELTLQGQLVANVLSEARKRLPSAFDEQQLRALTNEQDHTLDAFYAGFEEQFRGSQTEIKERLKIYLPVLREHRLGDESSRVLDVGCGRGEWLELLYEQGFMAEGVDSNRVLVQSCKERGLKVVEQDLFDYLRQVPDATLGAVTGFHIIEHLPIEGLVKLLNESLRVLQPGGAVIFETPNPQNVLVGSCNFYFDPTHRNPLPSQVTKFLVESRGFAEVQVLNLNPSDDTPVDETSELARRFNQYFYGPMDYAVIGFKV